MIKHFDSIADYFRFSAAREFYNNETGVIFNYEKHFLENIGERLGYPFFKGGDAALRNIRNPPMVVAMTIIGVATATFLFYPDITIQTTVKVFPQISYVESWMVKFTGYSFTNSVILSMGLRTFGRLSNQELMSEWTKKRLIPIHMGTYSN